MSAALLLEQTQSPMGGAGSFAIAVGNGAAATMSGAGNASPIAIGVVSKADGEAVAIGNSAFAKGSGSAAIGLTATASGAGSVAMGGTSNASAVNATAIGLNATAANANSVALGANSVTSTANSVSSVTVGGSTFGVAGTAPAGVVSVGSSGQERQITNVAAGRITATSTDAVNGSELNATNLAVNALSTSTATGLSSANSAIASLSTSTSTGIGSLSTGLSATNSAVASLSTSTSTGIGSLSTGLSATNSAVTSLSTSTANGIGSLSTSLSTTNVTLNSLSTSFSSLTSGATGTGSTAMGTGAAASGANSVAVGGRSTASGVDSMALGTNSTSSGTSSVALGANSTDEGRSNVVSIGSPSQARQITNMAAGTAATDGVNVQQLNDAMSQSVAQANGYTDRQIQSVNNRIDSVRRDSDGGIAAAMAVAGLPQPTQPGMSMVAVSGSVYRGQSGQAIGVSHVTGNNHWVYKAAVSSNTRGTYGAVVSGGYQW
ncbi:YadA family autotransporter adhesin [Burkholderia sp. BE17]|uniref:YadA family autotransporter adhesin n=1 Tax=Burkholderia sp. BE17 TaxID=2656644 RepID=UPI002AB11E5E|nr:YadA-like family protein [Burkholderia sp. BE17]